MGSGMGIPSMGIYSYELYHFYGVDAIIRIGSAGGLADGIQVRDLVIGMGACTNSNYAAQFKLPGMFAPIADFGLLRRAVEVAEGRGLHAVVGNLLSSDMFYDDNTEANAAWKKMNVLAVEMEAAGLLKRCPCRKKGARDVYHIRSDYDRRRAVGRGTTKQLPRYDGSCFGTGINVRGVKNEERGNTF